jgi:hypothetical protein
MAFLISFCITARTQADEKATVESSETRTESADKAPGGHEKAPVKVMVIIQSIEIDTTFLGVAAEGNRSAENQIENSLMQHGFEVLDAGQLKRRKEIEFFLSKGDPLAANRVAGDFGAQILIYGEVRRSFVGGRLVMGRPTRFFSNELRLKAMETRTGRVLFSGYQTRPPSGEGATLPLEEATSDLCDKLISAIEGKKANTRSKTERYEVSVEDISFDFLPDFVRALEGIDGLKSATMQGFESGHALIGVEYEGSLMNLAEQIGRMKGIAVEIVSVQSNAIKTRLKK